jgi:glucokinase
VRGKCAEYLLAYDIGGSHITAGLCLPPMTVMQTAIAPLLDTISSNAFIHLLHDLGRQLIGSGGTECAGAALAFPGPFAYDTGTSYMRHKLKNLYGVDLKTALAATFRWVPDKIHFLNDADAALLGEARAGAAQGAARAVGMTLGSGIGFAFVQDGSLNQTAPGLPPDNEIWNLPFQGGIVEDLLSSRALEGDYEARAGRYEPVAAIALQAANDPDARAVFHTFGEHLGQVIKEIIAPIGPDVVVLGGGISRSSHLFLPAARNQLKESGIRLVPSVLLERAPLVGAAMDWRDRALLRQAIRA